MLRQFHCLVFFARNSSSGHGLALPSERVSLAKSSFVPSGSVMLVIGLPVAFSAVAIWCLRACAACARAAGPPGRGVRVLGGAPPNIQDSCAPRSGIRGPLPRAGARFSRNLWYGVSGSCRRLQRRIDQAPDTDRQPWSGALIVTQLARFARTSKKS